MEHLAIELNELCETLNHINEEYPRRCGTLVMVSPETEDQIESLLNRMSELMGKLSNATDDEIAVFYEDIEYYRDFLKKLEEFIAKNREEVAKARDFLARYYA